MINLIKQMLSSKRLWLHTGLMLLVFIISIVAIKWWLSNYTLHGQSITLPDYIGKNYYSTKSHAEGLLLDLVVLDSVFIVGKSGGEILQQHPEAGSKVKENRKVYVSITKSQPEFIEVAQLPILYGKSFERKARELKQGYEINTTIAGYWYDPGNPDHILVVLSGADTIITRRGRKNNRKIEKGGTLSFILSKSMGGKIDLPDLLCMTYSEARFILETHNVQIRVIEDGAIGAIDDAYIWKQSPPHSSSQKIEMGSTVSIYLTQYKPSFCP